MHDGGLIRATPTCFEVCGRPGTEHIVGSLDTIKPGQTWYACNHAPAFGDPLGRTSWSGHHRGGFNATRAETAHTMVIGDNTWFIPGLHASIGDRIASTSGALRRHANIDLLFINQIKEMNLSGGGDNAEEFTVKVGINRAAMTVGERNARMVKKALDKLNDLGVRLVS